MEGAQNKLMGQLEGMKGIPMAVINNWPAWFGFFATNYAAGVILRMIPAFGGAVGVIESAAVNGSLNVLNHVTWEKLRVA